MKKLFWILMLFILLFIPSQGAFGSNYPAVIINEKVIDLESVRVLDNFYYIEVKELISNCEFDYWFIEEDNSVTIFTEDSTISISINNSYSIDGIVYYKLNLVIVENDDYYISLREFANIMGYSVHWISEHLAAKLSTQKAYNSIYVPENTKKDLMDKRAQKRELELQKLQQEIEDRQVINSPIIEENNVVKDKKPASILPPLNPNIKPPSDRSKIAYLTFDDGPTSTTPKVLDILKQYEVKATFFVIGGNAKRNPEIIKRIHNEGHGIANHTFTHNNELLYRSPYHFWEELDKTNDVLNEIIGVKTKMVRVPYGSSLFTLQYLEYIKNRDGYKVYGWNIDSQDSLPTGRTAEQIYLNVVNGVKRTTTPLILFHDSNGKGETLRALPHIIEYLWENGYTIEALDYSSELKSVIR